MARKRYLKKTPLKEAQELLLQRVESSQLKSQTLPIADALNRITAEPIFARTSAPHYHASAMDGICVRAEDTFGATEFSPRRLKRFSDGKSVEGAFAYLDTGNALPLWANAVIMIEKVRQLDEERVEILESVPPWHHVRLVGEDVVATDRGLRREHYDCSDHQTLFR